uniref:RING-type E3 ubiquitin transferase n=1 Tax=Melopsittacus undulatus TaxID=13146 RepID=A0A8V5GIX4_MELUD
MGLAVPSAASSEGLQQSSSAMTAGSSRLERAGRQEAVADVLCTICMSNISDAAYVDGCLHSFCFGCIQQWAVRRAVCPLCRRPFDQVLPCLLLFSTGSTQPIFLIMKYLSSQPQL